MRFGCVVYLVALLIQFFFQNVDFFPVLVDVVFDVAAAAVVALDCVLECLLNFQDLQGESSSNGKTLQLHLVTVYLREILILDWELAKDPLKK